MVARLHTPTLQEGARREIASSSADVCFATWSAGQQRAAFPRRNGLRERILCRAAFAVVTAVVTAGLPGCGGSASDAVAPPASAAASIAITPSAPAVVLGSQVALQAEVYDPAGRILPGATVFWSSLDSNVATVAPTGVLTGRAVGTTQVAASSSGRSAIVPVSVVPVPVASIAIAPSAANVNVGGTVDLKAMVYDATNQVLAGRSIVWASSASQVASVDNSGAVTGVSAGTASITATSEAKTASATVTVSLVPVASVAVTPASAALVVGRSASLSAVMTDANGNVLSGRPVVWASANPAIATVTALGLVTGAGPGSTAVTATSGGNSGVAQIIVSPAPPAPVASVTVSPSNVNLSIGASAALSVTLRDSAGTALSGRVVAWTSSNATVASVTNAGVVTATGAGTATIAATSEGRSGTATVTVQAPKLVPVASVRISPATVTLRSDQTRTLTAQVLDANGKQLTGRIITWTSSNGAAVTVTVTGPSTAVVSSTTGGPGTAVITATCEGVSGTSIVTFT